MFASIAAITPTRATSHMDAPLVTLDPAATTDVYAFVSQNVLGQKFLTTALAIFPFEQPGIGRIPFASTTASHMTFMSPSTTISPRARLI